MNILLIILIYSSISFGAVRAGKLEGSFNLNCTQTQTSSFSGFIKEKYTFYKNNFSHEIKYFKDSKCKSRPSKLTVTNGSFKLSNENLNNGFNPKGTTTIRFSVRSNVDTGLVWLSPNLQKLRISRGLDQVENTLLGIFIYTRDH